MTTVTQTRTIHTVRGGGGLRLHVREWGRADGPPILLMHGWSQSHLCWAKQYQSALAAVIFWQIVAAGVRARCNLEYSSRHTHQYQR